MPKTKEPSCITLTPDELEALKVRIANPQDLTDRDIKIILKFIEFNEWIQERLSRAKLTIKRLRKLFGFKSESSSSSSTSSGGDDKADPANKDEEECTAASVEDAESDPSQGSVSKNSASEQAVMTPRWDDEQNHGRYGAEEYVGCPLIEIDFDAKDGPLKDGFCPCCLEDGVSAKVYPDRTNPTSIVLLVGKPLISGDRYQLNCARCSICGKRFTASLPDELKEQPKYDVSCNTTLAIHHYYAGLPFSRIENLQKAQGVPLADATQWDLMERFYNTALHPVFLSLKSCAAQGNSFYYDDTPGRILSQIALNKALVKKNNKHAVHSTALLSEYEGRRITLFLTSTRTAGQEFKRLLEERKSEESFHSMSDALSSNFPELEESLLSRWIISLCMAHGRRHFFDLMNDDEDAKFVVDIFSRVYEYDAYCKKEKMTDEERLAYHKEHSAPLMEALRIWLNNLIIHKKVEPNSLLGTAIMYLLKRWQWLTQFLRVPGAAIDNNLCEQAVKILIRYRKNSLFYKTSFGAQVGDAVASLVHTAIYHDVDVFDYFNTLQRYSKDVQSDPDDWLPWNYQSTLKDLFSPPVKAVNSS